MIHPEGRLLAYTDGSTWKSNPGPMAWAVVWVRDGQLVQGDDGVARTQAGAYREGTNNRAELMGVVWAMEHECTEDITVVTDSMVTVKCANGIYQRHANRDLWARFEEALQKRARRGLETRFVHVKGHHVDPFNRMADRLAGEHAEHAFGGVFPEDEQMF